MCFYYAASIVHRIEILCRKISWILLDGCVKLIWQIKHRQQPSMSHCHWKFCNRFFTVARRSCVCEVGRWEFWKMAALSASFCLQEASVNCFSTQVWQKSFWGSFILSFNNVSLSLLVSQNLGPNTRHNSRKSVFCLLE